MFATRRRQTPDEPTLPTWSGVSVEYIRRRAEELPSRSFVLLGHLVRNGDGAYPNEMCADLVRTGLVDVVTTDQGKRLRPSLLGVAVYATRACWTVVRQQPPCT